MSNTLRLNSSTTITGVTVTSGALSFSANTLVIQMPLPAPQPPPAAGFQFLAYAAGDPQTFYGRAHVLVFPYWAFILVLTVPLMMALRSEYRSLVRNRRLRDGLCINCGYDLRASPERCPECGLEAPSAPNPLSLAGRGPGCLR
jgi:hypothetical protein